MASFMGSTITKNIELTALRDEMNSILLSIKEEFSWLYLTNHNSNTKGIINYILWSDVFNCPYCSTEYIYWNEAVDEKTLKFKEDFKCPSCKADISKKSSNVATYESYDPYADKVIEKIKQVPVLINYKVGNITYVKKPDNIDHELLEKIENYDISSWFPYISSCLKMVNGGYVASRVHLGVSYTHHFFTKRNLIVLSRLFQLANNSINRPSIIYCITSFLVKQVVNCIMLDLKIVV